MNDLQEEMNREMNMLGRVLFASALLVSGSCFAQATVGELAKQGGTKLSKNYWNRVCIGSGDSDDRDTGHRGI